MDNKIQTYTLEQKGKKLITTNLKYILDTIEFTSFLKDQEFKLTSQKIYTQKEVDSFPEFKSF